MSKGRKREVDPATQRKRFPEEGRPDVVVNQEKKAFELQLETLRVRRGKK